MFLGASALLADPGIVLRTMLLLDRLAPFATDLGIELGAALGLDGLAALLPDLGVELTATLFRDGLAALLADPGVELRTVLPLDGFAALLAGLANGHFATLFFLGHVLPPPHRKDCSNIDPARMGELAALFQLGPQSICGEPPRLSPVAYKVSSYPITV